MKKAQVFETVSKNPLFQDKVLFIDLDAEKHMEISQAFNLRSVPTILFIQNGQILAEHKGALTVNDLVTKIKTCFGIK
jgi:thioredoxin-like negative regulator of GroEL